MKKSSFNTSDRHIRVEINPDTLMRLLRSRQMAVIEMKCLDQESRDQLRQLCLESILL